MSKSLNAQFADLHAERVRTMDPAKLQININQRRDLVDAFDPSKAVRVGDTVAPFTLLDVDGGTITDRTLLADGPAVLIVFRFAGCPACNLALPYYHRELWPALSAAGVKLVAISPQLPERLREIKTRHALGFTIASDPDNALGRRLGVTYQPNAGTRAGGEGPGWIGETLGTNSWELPQPTVILLAPDGTARFVDISPDWLVRTEAPAILDAVARLQSSPSGRVREAVG